MGERTRALMALFQAREVNVLVLDEPTNHLDVPAIEQLESALADFAGTLVVVSHDQRFLEAVGVTRRVRSTGAGSPRCSGQANSACPTYSPGPMPGGTANSAPPVNLRYSMSSSRFAIRSWSGMKWVRGSRR